MYIIATVFPCIILSTFVTIVSLILTMASNLGILCFHLTDKETEIKPSGPNFPTYFPFFFLLNKSLKKFSMYYCPKRG